MNFAFSRQFGKSIGEHQFYANCTVNLKGKLGDADAE